MLKVVATVDVLNQGTEMGAFLRRCRARLRPEDVGLTRYGTRRRVPGLRREELAQLAGVSVAYYTRLEQGQSRNASDGVLDAIARALQLDDDETAHLRNLARPAQAGRARSRPERLRPGLADLVDSFGMPAYVVGRYGDILAWNRMAHALLAGHVEYDAVHRPADRPNLSRMLFLDPHTSELYVDWHQRARRSVACLRVTAGRHQGDPRLTTLIGELAMRSPTFATLWSAHHVRRCASSRERYRHPLVGPLTLNEEVLDLPDDNGQQLILLVADHDPASQAALDLLAAVTTRRPESIQHGETAPVKAK